MHVLVVDDDPDVRRMVTDALGIMGLEARQAINGKDAMERVTGGDDQPSVIVLDLMMPVMDGFSTLAALQRGQASRGIPVIVMTALADSSSRIGSFPGVIGVVKKGDFQIEQFRGLLVKAGVIATL